MGYKPKNQKGKGGGRNNVTNTKRSGSCAPDKRKPFPNQADKKERWQYFESADMSKENDPSWYNRFADLAKNVSNFNFHVPVGSKVDWGTAFPDWNNDRFPGVMALYFAPAFGDAVDGETSPLNMASNRLYQFVRFENNGSSVYDRGDLMLYLLAMDSCYMYFAFMRRLYGMISDYSTINRYMPRALIRANRVNYEDLRLHIADFRGYINEFAAKLSMLPVPNDMAYLRRHMWMSDNLFIDQDVARCQLYMFVPQYFSKFGVYKDGIHAGEPYLDLVNPSYGSLMSYSDIVQFGNELITPLVAEEDFNLIGSDIIKAFGTNGLFRVDTVPDNYQVLPVYSEEVLDQIQNTCAVGHPACMPIGEDEVQLNGGHAVYWDPETNLLKPYVWTWAPQYAFYEGQLGIDGFMGNRLINFEKDTVTHDDLFVATRLATAVSGGGYSGVGHWRYFTLTGIGSEIVCDMVVFFYTADGANDDNWRLGQTYPLYYHIPNPSVIGSFSAGMTPEDFQAVQDAQVNAAPVITQATARQFGMLEKFRRHPAVYPIAAAVYVAPDDSEKGWYVQGVSSAGDYKLWSRYRIGDVDNYAMLTPTDLKNIADVALQSEFYVPMAANGPVSVSRK